MTDETGAEGIPPHVASEFYLWLWYTSDTSGGTLPLGDEGEVQFWVDDRLAFRAAGEDKVSAVLTGENPGSSLEARAAVRGGKVLRDVRLAVRREGREYTVTLRGPGVEITAARVPGLLKGGDEAELLYERMFLYEELHWLVAQLFRRFAEERVSEGWRTRTVPALRAWLVTRGAA
jgi:hypothetical protein